MLACLHTAEPAKVQSSSRRLHTGTKRVLLVWHARSVFPLQGSGCGNGVTAGHEVHQGCALLLLPGQAGPEGPAYKAVSARSDPPLARPAAVSGHRLPCNASKFECVTIAPYSMASPSLDLPQFVCFHA